MVFGVVLNGFWCCLDSFGGFRGFVWVFSTGLRWFFCFGALLKCFWGVFQNGVLGDFRGTVVCMVLKHQRG